MTDTADVCIIGGGVVGLFCALELASSGKSVRLIDKLYIGSSRNNIGDILLQGHQKKALPFMKYSKDCWKVASDQFGQDMGYEKRGSISLGFSEKQVSYLRDEAEADNAVGLTSEVVDDMEEILKRLDIRELHECLRGAKFSADDGVIDTTMALDGLRKLVIQKGVRIWGSDEVTEFITDGDKVTGVKTNSGEECQAEQFIVAAGVWSGRILEKLGIVAPIRPARTHLFEMSPNGRTPDQLIYRRFKAGDIIIKPRRNGRTLVSYTGVRDQAQASWNLEVDQPLVKWVQTRAAEMIPSLQFAKLHQVRTVTAAVTPDESPYIGRTSAYPNLILAAGFNGKSYAFSAGCAKYVLSIIDNLPIEFDDSQLKLDRKFGGAATEVAEEPEAPHDTLQPDAHPEEEEVAEEEPPKEKEAWVDPFKRQK